MTVKSTDIKLGLKNSFKAPGWRVFFEVGNDTGQKVTRHADAVVIGIWPSNGHLIHGFEIKVTRADFLNEMKDPTKSQAVFQYCDKWSLVTPPGLVKVDEVPDPWGLMTFDGKSMRTVKQAPKLEPVGLTGGFVAAMLRRAGEADDALLDAAYHRGVEAERTNREQREKRLRDRAGHDAVARDTDAVRKLAEYREVFGDMPIFKIRQLAPALKAVQQFGAESTAQRLRHVLSHLEAVQQKVDPLIQEIEENSLFGDLL